MGYYVLGDQGQKYGPADIPTLNQWIAEGRIVPHTMLQDEASGGMIAASTIPGLLFLPTASPVSSNYPRYNQAPQYQAPAYTSSSGSSDNGPITLAFAMALVSPILSFFLPIGGLLTAMWGIRSAIRAKDNGHPLGVIAIVACGVAIAFWGFIRIAGIGRGMFLR